MGHTSKIKYQRLHVHIDFFHCFNALHHALTNVAEAASAKQTGHWPSNSGKVEI
jgi:hypothetical protein